MNKLNVLSVALLSSFALPACSVDSPERDNFDYSFLDAEDIEPPAADLPLSATPADASIEVHFRDSLHGIPLPEQVKNVSIVIDSVEVLRDGGHEKGTWKVISSRSHSLDLLSLTVGNTATLASGPIGDGEFLGVRFRIPKASALTPAGEVEVALPGEYLYIEHEFETVDLETTSINVNFGGLRSLEESDTGWSMDPNVSMYVDIHE